MVKKYEPPMETGNLENFEKRNAALCLNLIETLILQTEEQIAESPRCFWDSTKRKVWGTGALMRLNHARTVCRSLRGRLEDR